MRPAGKEILAYLQDCEAEMLAAIEAMAGIESPSSDAASQIPLREFLAPMFAELSSSFSFFFFFFFVLLFFFLCVRASY